MPDARMAAALARGRLVWAVILVPAVAVLSVDRIHQLPLRVGGVAAVVFATAVAIALAFRAGGRPMLPAVVTFGYTAVAVATQWQTLLCGAAVMTGVVSALLALMVTTPASTYWRAVFEVVIALAVATVGGLAAAGFRAQLNPSVYEYVVFGIALLAALALVYRLGAGLHGLGRRGYFAAGVTTLLLAFVIAYSAALGRWGSHFVTDAFGRVQHVLTDYLLTVPHPLDTLVGVPALCWGVFMRARRRQGWWVCAFGIAMTGPAAARFLGHFPVHIALLSATYSLVVGLALGYGLIRIEQSLTGSRGRRARRSEEASAHRPEPERVLPLR